MRGPTTLPTGIVVLVGLCVIAGLALVGCTVGSAASLSLATPAVTAAAATPTAAPSPTPSSPPPSPTTALSTTYTADDEQIAKLIRADVAEAIPQLKRLNKTDPSKQVDLFTPLGAWIKEQKAGVQAYTPTNCTAAAVALFLDGLNQYDAMRKKFLAWKDWGAHGHAFALGAPREAAATFEKSLVELEAHCPG